MIRLVLLLFFTAASGLNAEAQRLLERSGSVTFFSEAPLEDIRATNAQVLAIIDTESGEVAVSMLMKGFQFKKALMQEHFNENYVESDRFPKATFTGHIREYTGTTLTRPGRVLVSGDITIHGVTRPLQTMITLTPAGDGAVKADGNFELRVADFDIEIPSLVVDNIAEVVEVSLALELKPESDL